MGSSHSSHRPEDRNGEVEEDVEDTLLEGDDDEEDEERVVRNPRMDKILEQEPEILICHPSASPISPQLSALGTPRVLSASASPSIKVWDPCNVLGPPPPPVYPRGFVEGFGDGADRVTEVFLVVHGECGVGLRSDLVEGRWPEVGLTGLGERQARALAVLLNSQGIRFNAVWSSPLERARTTAAFVCRELEFAEEHIQTSDALVEMSNGQWEGCHRSEIYTPEMASVIDRTISDFSAPSGESLRQVEFRMTEFLNRTVIKMPEKLSTISMLLHQNERKGFSRHSSTDSFTEQTGPVPPHWDLLHRHGKPGLTRKKSGKSRLQFVTTGDHETEDEFSPSETNHLHEVNTRNPASSIGIFTHATPIKCLLTGLLECSPAVATRICIDDSSVTVLEHSLRTGWRIKRLNDTAHLRLL